MTRPRAERRIAAGLAAITPHRPGDAAMLGGLGKFAFGRLAPDAAAAERCLDNPVSLNLLRAHGFVSVAEGVDRDHRLQLSLAR